MLRRTALVFALATPIVHRFPVARHAVQRQYLRFGERRRLGRAARYGRDDYCAPDEARGGQRWPGADCGAPAELTAEFERMSGQVRTYLSIQVHTQLLF